MQHRRGRASEIRGKERREEETTGRAERRRRGRGRHREQSRRKKIRGEKSRGKGDVVVRKRRGGGGEARNEKKTRGQKLQGEVRSPQNTACVDKNDTLGSLYAAVNAHQATRVRFAADPFHAPGSFLTMAFRLAMRMTPSANVTVTTIGRPSGIAATAL